MSADSKGTASFEDADLRLIKLVAVRAVAVVLTARGLSELIPTMVQTAFQWWHRRTSIDDRERLLHFMAKVMYGIACVLVVTGHVQPGLLPVAGLVLKLVPYFQKARGIYLLARDAQHVLSHNPRKLIEWFMILIMGLGVLNEVLTKDFTVIVTASSIAMYLKAKDSFLLKRNALFPGQQILFVGLFLQAVSLDIERGVVAMVTD